MATLPPGGALITHQVALPRGQKSEEIRREWASAASDWWEAKLNLFDCFVKYSRNMLVHLNILAILNQRSLNILSISTQHSIHIKSTFSQHSIHIKSTFFPHYFHVQSTAFQHLWIFCQHSHIISRFFSRCYKLFIHIFSIFYQLSINIFPTFTLSRMQQHCVWWNVGILWISW